VRHKNQALAVIDADLPADRTGMIVGPIALPQPGNVPAIVLRLGGLDVKRCVEGNGVQARKNRFILLRMKVVG
jgi:hypothetical protein